jgi:hypothetical protein
MIRAHAAGVNARTTPPPVPPFTRWHCPLCGASYRHPWYLATHLAAVDPARPDHGLTELDAWTLAATVQPVDVSPGLDRYPTLPAIPMAAPPAVR